MVVDRDAAHSRAKDVEHKRNGRRKTTSSDDVTKHVRARSESSRWCLRKDDVKRGGGDEVFDEVGAKVYFTGERGREHFLE